MTEKTMVKGDVELLDMIEMSEPGNAERLALIARGHIHYVDTWFSWIVYRDGVWVRDDAGVGLQELAKKVPKSVFTMAETLTGPEDEDYRNLHVTWARKSNTEPQLKRMVTLARDLPGIRINFDELDAKPLLLNLQNGTFDFKTGTFREHDPGDLLTKMAMVSYDSQAKCPAWLGYLNQWQPDMTVQRFLQEITGSGLMGEPVQNLFMNVGEGRNGKGTFYKQIQYILGTSQIGYAGTAPEDMLVESNYKVHEEEKARLRGIRLLIAPETSVGDRLDEAGIKNMTGGDIIHARHLYGKPFDFKPSHTAFLHTNYDPGIRGTDAAIWARVVKIMWDYTVPFDQRDPEIDHKLEAERPGILNWLIEGALRFRKIGGVRPPKRVMEWTEGYRVAQDQIGRFVEDMFETMVADAQSLGKVDYIPASILRKHYEQWCLNEGTRPWVTASVGKELRHKGWEPASVKVGGKTIRVWDYHGSESAVPVTSSDQGLSTPVTPVTPLSILNPIAREKEEEPNTNERLNQESAVIGVTAVTEPTEAETEQAHREWLRDHGYPVPPTDEELDEYWNTPWDEPEPEPEALEPPPWGEEE